MTCFSIPVFGTLEGERGVLMHVTVREKEIIDLLITSSQPYTTPAIAKVLDVSPRTVQRDLQAIEKILTNYQLTLRRNVHNELLVEGANENIFRLVQSLTKTETIDESPEQRKLRLLLALLAEDFYKIQVLANSIGISITTLSTYLTELQDFLDDFQVDIVRKRGVGVELIGSEQNKRRALARYYLYFFYEALLEELLAVDRKASPNKRVLYYFMTEDLYAIEQVVYQVMLEEQAKLADYDFAGALIHIYIAAKRTDAGHLLDAMPDDLAMDTALKIAKQICERLRERFAFSFVEEDIMDLAVLLKSSKWQVMDTAAYDRADLNLLVTDLMAYISKEMHVNVSNDFSLHQGLLAHLEPSLFRLQENMGLFNPLKEEIKEKYPVLFAAVKQFFTARFPHIEQIPEDEIAFIVLHFGSAFVMSEEKIALHVLLICPTGIGTSKMLASRMKQEFPEIEAVHTTTMKALQAGDLEQYDMVVSTVRLPFTSIPYVFVSPLLHEEEIEQIHGFIQQNMEKFTKKQSYRKYPAGSKQTADLSFTSVLNDLKYTYEGAEQITRHFRVFHTDSEVLNDILWDMLIENEKQHVLLDKQAVFTALQDRATLGGLAIPDTSLALYHCRDSHIKELSFHITKLAKPIPMKGMDGKQMHVQTILLLLAPAEAHDRTLEMISLISANLIESAPSILMYETANEAIIKNHLEQLLLQYMQRKKR